MRVRLDDVRVVVDQCRDSRFDGAEHRGWVGVRVWWVDPATCGHVVGFLPSGVGEIVRRFAELIWVLCREMAVGNTFGATALSSYGGFWLSFAVILTPGGFDIVDSAGKDFINDFGLFLMVRLPRNTCTKF